MIRKSTTLVLGAGASAPYGYPTGKKLRDFVLNNSWTNKFAKDLYFKGVNLEKVKEFIDSLGKSSDYSVDAFLEHRTEFIDIGKFAMTLGLIEHEDENILFKTNSWYQHLFNSMNASFDDFSENKLSVITFNYDRSFEHFLFNALKHKYGKKDDECSQVISKTPIIHVHGTIGNLPWMGTGFIREYGDSDNFEKVYESSQQIKIVHEKDKNDKQFNEAFNLLNKSERIYFLGFGYHEMNIKRLKFNSLNFSNKLILGSSYGLTDREAARIKNSLFNRKIGFPNKYVQPNEILDFLREQVTFD